MQTHSFLFPKDKFSRREASRWIAKHNAEERKVDTTENYYRFRQSPPSHFREETFRTITIGSGVKAVVGLKKRNQKKSKPK